MNLYRLAAPSLLTFALAACVVVSPGCQDRSQRFIPAPKVAEAAMKDAMAAWQAGQPCGPVEGTSPLVHVTDTNRKPQQKLEGFKILGEKPSKHGRTFVIELTLSNPPETRKAEYIIVGIDPLWIFQKDDYELLMHWDHHMPEQSKPKP